MDDEARVGGYVRVLSICHYIYALLATGYAAMGIFYVLFGQIFQTLILLAPPDDEFSGPLAARMFAWMFAILGGFICVLGLAVAVLAALSGRAMERNRNRTLSLVVAGILCMTGLLGIALGVFTFIVLLKPETERLYAGAETAPPA